ncbi:peptidase inhibitor I78 [Brevundimonas sp.]|uniref:peptidase inhibitor I78 n=1 Tax=Brevundimonas sp. TaxID=1871086 RepID=UPI002730318D|nr:peptidase inhibitor I78 [Brevundimonas sp.]MDP1912625.1 peptidase inhibitor I78 [Brevundimonas sp.]
MKTLILAFAAAGLMTACAPAPVEENASPRTTPSRNPTTPAVSRDNAPRAAPPLDGPEQCRADQFQRYIGRNRSELPPRPTNEIWRVTCTTCPVTMDYSPSRLNILFDETTGVIREVKCG